MDFCLFWAFCEGKYFRNDAKNTGLSASRRFLPKVKSPRMGLSIIPRQFLQRPLPFSQYLAPLGAKYMKKRQKIDKKLPFSLFIKIPI